MALAGWLFLAGSLTCGFAGVVAAIAMPFAGGWFLVTDLRRRNRWWAASPRRASARAARAYTATERDTLATQLYILAAPGVLAGVWSLAVVIGLAVIPGTFGVYYAADKLRRGRAVGQQHAWAVLTYALLVAAGGGIYAATVGTDAVRSGEGVADFVLVTVLGALWVVPSVIAAWKLWVVARTRRLLVLPEPPAPDPATRLSGQHQEEVPA